MNGDRSAAPRHEAATRDRATEWFVRVVRASGRSTFRFRFPFFRFRFPLPFPVSAFRFRFHYACSAERVATKPFRRVVFASGPREWLTDASRNKSRTAPFVRVVLYSYIHIFTYMYRRRFRCFLYIYIYIYVYKCSKHIWVIVFRLIFLACSVAGRGSPLRGMIRGTCDPRPAAFLAFLVFSLYWLCSEHMNSAFLFFFALCSVARPLDGAAPRNARPRSPAICIKPWGRCDPSIKTTRKSLRNHSHDHSQI